MMKLSRKLFSKNKNNDSNSQQNLMLRQQRLALDQQHQMIQQGKSQISQMNAITNTQRASNAPVRFSLQAQRNGIEAVKVSRRNAGRMFNVEKERSRYTQPVYENKPKRVVSMN